MGTHAKQINYKGCYFLLAIWEDSSLMAYAVTYSRSLGDNLVS